MPGAWRRLWLLVWFAVGWVGAAAEEGRAPQFRFATAWQTQVQWAAERAARDAWSLVQWAAGRDPWAPPPDGPRPDPASPQFEAWVAGLVDAAALAAPPALAPNQSQERLYARDLADFREQGLVRLDRELSRALSERPTDPALHRRAALLLAVLALKEDAGVLHDHRLPVLRARVHIALAAALGNKSSTGESAAAERAWLELARQLLTLREKGLAATAPGSGSPPAKDLSAPAAWADAAAPLLAFLALPTVEGERPDERWGVRVLATRLRAEELGAEAAWDHPSVRSVRSDGPDIARACLSWGGADLRNEALADLHRAEFELGGTLYAHFYGLKEGWEEALKDYAARPEGPLAREANGQISFAVVGWPMWAAHLRRHMGRVLLEQVARLDDDQLTSSLLKNCLERYGEWATRAGLSPWVDFMVARDPVAYPSAREALAQALRRAPEDAPPGVWRAFFAPPNWGWRDAPPTAPDRSDRAALLGWWLPPGAVAPPPQHPQPLPLLLPGEPDGEERRALRALALRLQPGRPATPADIEAAWGAEMFRTPRRRALWAAASIRADREADAVTIAPQLLREAPALLDDLVHAWFERGRSEQAVEWLERGLEARYRPYAALAFSSALRAHFSRKGAIQARQVVAQALAFREGPDGLQAQAEMLWSKGKRKEARELLLKIYQVHGDPRPLARQLYWDSISGSSAEKREAQEQLKELQPLVLPRGLEVASMQALSAPPADGVILRCASPEERQMGLEDGDILVAVQMRRVRSSFAWSLLMEASTGRPLEIVVWRRGTAQRVLVPAKMRRHLRPLPTYFPAEEPTRRAPSA